LVQLGWKGVTAVPGDARELLAQVQREFAPAADDNRLVPAVAAGEAPLAVIAALAAEQHRIIPSDRRSFLVLAARTADAPAGEFFAGLAQGESLALATLPALAAACGMDAAAVRDYPPRAGCQAYPAYVAWLALNGAPADVALALVANFDAWGRYCATLARALREHYQLDDTACAFFDFFATPAPDVELQALAAVQAALTGGQSLHGARQYARLLQTYELMFWNTLADDIA
jgi:hypothetical protein